MLLTEDSGKVSISKTKNRKLCELSLSFPWYKVSPSLLNLSMFPLSLYSLFNFLTCIFFTVLFWSVLFLVMYFLTLFFSFPTHSNSLLLVFIPYLCIFIRLLYTINVS